MNLELSKEDEIQIVNSMKELICIGDVLNVIGYKCTSGIFECGKITVKDLTIDLLKSKSALLYDGEVYYFINCTSDYLTSDSRIISVYKTHYKCYVYITSTL